MRIAIRLVLSTVLMASLACGSTGAKAGPEPQTEIKKRKAEPMKTKSVEALEALAEAYFKKTMPELAIKRVGFDDELLFDWRGAHVDLDEDEAPGPFVFVAAMVVHQRKGPRPPRPVVAVDARTGQVYDKDPACFEALLAGVGWTNGGRIAPEGLIGAYAACTFGLQMNVMTTSDHSSEVVRQLVKAPVATDAAGVTTVVGWTAGQRGLGLQRHTLTISSAGKMLKAVSDGARAAAGLPDD